MTTTSKSRKIHSAPREIRQSSRKAEEDLLEVEKDLYRTTVNLRKVKSDLKSLKHRHARDYEDMVHTQREVNLLLGIVRKLSRHISSAPPPPRHEALRSAEEDLIRQASVGNKLRAVFDTLRSSSEADPPEEMMMMMMPPPASPATKSSLRPPEDLTNGSSPSLEEMSRMNEDVLKSYFMSRGHLAV
eukprot:g4226.t1